MLSAAPDDEAITSVENAETRTSTPVHRFPPPFYCPLTHQLFLDPVVAPDGLSYERNVVLLQNPEIFNNENNGHIMLQKPQFHPNRALQQIMKEYQELNGEDTNWNGDADFSGDTWEAGIRRSPWDRFHWHNRGSTSGDDGAGDDGGGCAAAPAAAGGGGGGGFGVDRPLPDAFYCPITFDLLRVPVIDPEGNTYEKSAIVSWILANGTSPLSRSPLTCHDLYPNHAIRQLLELFANDQNVDGMRTTIPVALLQCESELPLILPETNGDGQQQQQQEEGSIPPVIPNTYPFTLQQLEEYYLCVLKLQKKVFFCTILGIIGIVSAVILLAISGSGVGTILLVFSLCCVCSLCPLVLEWLADQQSRIRYAHQRLLQLRQQEQQQNPNNNYIINNDKHIIDDSTINNDNTTTAAATFAGPNQEDPGSNEQDIVELGGDAPDSITLSAAEER